MHTRIHFSFINLYYQADLSNEDMHTASFKFICELRHCLEIFRRSVMYSNNSKQKFQSNFSCFILRNLQLIPEGPDFLVVANLRAT